MALHLDPHLSLHNAHLEKDVLFFKKTDPHLRRLIHQPFIFKSPILEKLPKNKPGIYSLTGARQIGKTTLLKLWMEKLMTSGVSAHQIAFLTGEVIDDHHHLIRLYSELTREQNTNVLFYCIVDEITYIKDWDKAIKFLADAGQLENTALIISGSDLSLIKEARMRFPGRRGSAENLDFHYYPLHFKDAVELKHKQIDPHSPNFIEFLFKEFNHYLEHGGFLTAINELEKESTLTQTVFTTYADWIRGDVLKREKQETYLREIFFGIIKNYGLQISWNALSKHLSIDHPMTVANYIDLLTQMDVLFIQYPIMEDKLKGAPKKAKKVFFTDPFIFHSVFNWLYPKKNPYENQVKPNLSQTGFLGSFVESVVASHFRRFFPTFYIKAEGEIDIAYIDQGRFWPIEIKWKNQIQHKDLKQISKYKNSKIWGLVQREETLQHIKIEPLPVALWKLCEEQGSP